MKKKCMAVGGTAKKPASMEEQLAGIRGKVRPGYQAGGTVYRSGNSFTDQQIGEPMKGISSAGMSGQVDNMLDRTKAMPNSIASPPQYGGSVIPAQIGQQAMQAATNFGMPPAGTAPTAPSQTISTGDYSTGPKETGFVFSDGTRRDGLTQEQAKQLESQQAMQRAQQQANVQTTPAAAPLMTMAEKESSLGLNPNRTYTPGSAMDPLASGGGISQALKVANPSPSLPNVSVAQIPQIEPVGRNRQRNRGFADGGILDKLIRTVGKILPESNGQKYEPGIQSRAAEDPARHGRAEALNPRTQTAPSETPPAGGFQEEAARRRKQMEEAKNYESGGMVRFAGKGGPRDDQIPVKVAGQEINVSDGENAVILPAKTAANPAALYAIGGIIQATNDGRKPKMGMERGGKYKDGVYPYDDKRPPTSQEVYSPTYAAPGSIISALPEGGYLRTPEGRAQVMEALSGKGLRPDVGILGPRNAFPVAPVQSASPAQTYSNEGRPSALGQAYQSYKPQAQGIAAGVDNDSGAVVKDGMTTTQMGAGFDPTKLQMADGYGMMTNAAGKTIAAGNTEYVGADGKPTSRWTDTQQYKDAIARNEADKLRLAEMQARRLGADPMAIQSARQGIAGGVLAARTQEAGLQRNAQIQSLVAKAAAEPDQGKRQQFIDAALAMQGKDNKQEKNLQVVDLGSESAPDGMGGVKAIPRGQALYDASTKQWVPMESGRAPQTSFSKADVDSAIKAGASKEAVAARIKSMGMNPKDYGL